MIGNVLQVLGLVPHEVERDDDWITRDEAARLIGYHRDYISSLVLRGALKRKKKEQGRLYVSKSELMRYAKELFQSGGEQVSDWISTSEAHELTGFAPSYIPYLVRQNKLKNFKKEKGRYYVSRSELLRYAAKRIMDRKDVLAQSCA